MSYQSVDENITENHASKASIGRVFKEAPWRRHTQTLTGLAVVAVVLVVIATLSLAETSRAAAAGRDVQQLRQDIATIRYENTLLRSRIADAASVVSLEARARQQGLMPFSTDQIFNLPVPGFEESNQLPETQSDDVTPELPVYDETLQDWLAERIQWLTLRDK